MEEKIRVGLIGAGRAGMIHARNMACRVQGAQVVCVSDAEESNARSAAQEFGCEYAADYRTLLERSDIDAVIIAVPRNTIAGLWLKRPGIKNIFSVRSLWL